MINGSYICRFIRDNPNDWRQKLEDKNIKIKDDENLSIFNYGINADFTDPVVQEARGIIINVKTLDVACWPFRKFGNYTESYADDIDWTSARVQEKYDGSLVKLFYNDEIYRWQWSTMSTINAKDAELGEYSMSFLDLIKSADNYSSIDVDSLSTDMTWIFELVSPINRLVVKYPKAHLYHIGTRSNLDGREYDTSIGIDKPIEYSLKSLDDCVAAANKLNKDGSCQHEGFVVVDKNWHRVKIKSPEYLMLHRVANNGVLTKLRALQIIREHSVNIEQYCKDLPQLALPLLFYRYEYEKFKYQAEQMVIYTRNLYKEFSQDRGAVARVISKMPLSSIGFSSIGNDLSVADILNSLDNKRLSKFIPDFKRPRLEGI